LALDLQKLGLFVVIGLIVLVSTFNIASTLVILVRERMRDIGVLSALGLRPRQLVFVFLVYGMLLGGIGIAIGAALGSGISWLLTYFEIIRFGPEVAAIYFIDAVPFRVRPQDLAAVTAFALLITLAVSLWPALRATRIRPADALRYE
jgi:lipoprotein-releasing system permease protein